MKTILQLVRKEKNPTLVKDSSKKIKVEKAQVKVSSTKDQIDLASHDVLPIEKAQVKKKIKVEKHQV